MTIKQLGKWEYQTLVKDMREQGETEAVKDLEDTGFNNWYKHVFLIDEAWKEIRNNYKE